MELVTLVDTTDCQIGTMEKMAAHKEAVLHRAFSIFIFNAKGHVLLQQRASQKYHSGGLWTNACCSHPRPGESTAAAADRRLREEMGFTATLEKAFDFIYKAELDNNLVEHELDHVFVGEYNGQIVPDSSEVQDYCYKTVDSILESLILQPNKYTAWFQIAFPRLLEWLETRKNNSL